MSDMNGKVALVTGASSGIGRATAELFAAKGAKVVVAARREEELAGLVDSIVSSDGEASAVKTDVSDTNDVQGMVNHCIDTYGQLDYAVNNAGVEGQVAGIIDMPEDAWTQVIDINLKGIFLCLKYQAGAMVAAGNGGAIVNIGSVSSFLGFAGGAAYATSKHALVGLTSSASADLGPHGIRVNMVCPGVTKTPMHERIRETYGDEIFDVGVLPHVHLQRAGQPEEIAQSIVFLCSDEASYITGTTLTLDGGYTLTT